MKAEMVRITRLTLILCALIAFFLCVGPASSMATLIVNGGFEGGNSGFSSEYTYVPTPTSTPDLTAPRTYAVGTNPNSYHSSWLSFGDHTSGIGNMMIVNGAEFGPNDPIPTVWSQNINLMQGYTYNFSGWFASTYEASPAIIELSVNGATVASFSLKGYSDPTWQYFKTTWVAPKGGALALTIKDLEGAYSGNDFAIDDLELTGSAPVPIPAAAWLLGSGLIGLIAIRRRIRK